MAPETQLVERPRWSTPQAITRATDHNSAVGAFALNANETGFGNNAVGDSALFRNINGALNTAVGDLALEDSDSNGNSEANFNCAFGAQALKGMLTEIQTTLSALRHSPSTSTACLTRPSGLSLCRVIGSGASNIAIGDSAAAGNTSGSFNTVIGDTAGPDITDGTDNIYIGAGAGTGVGNETGTIRIGESGFIKRMLCPGHFGCGRHG